MRQKVIKSGKYSLAVIIPAHFVHALGIKASDDVTIKTDTDKGVVRLKFASSKQLPLPTESIKIRKKTI